MAFKRLQRSPSTRRVDKKARANDSSASRSSVRSFVGRLNLSHLRSSLTTSVTVACPLPVSIQCGLSETVSQYVALAAGSYLEVESMLLQEFAQVRRPGAIRSTQVGFMSPYYRGSDSDTQDEKHTKPSFEQVMTGTSGHVMVVMVELADPVADFEELIRFFFQIHDPTTRYRQGENRGFHYASWIFCGDQEQYNVAKRIRSEVQGFLDHGLLERIYSSSLVTTNMSIMSDFTVGPREHQQYALCNPDFRCRNNRLYFETWPSVSGDDASSVGFGSIGSDESDEKMETSARSSAHFRRRESLVHTMLRITMCDLDEQDQCVSVM